MPTPCWSVRHARLEVAYCRMTTLHCVEPLGLTCRQALTPHLVYIYYLPPFGERS